MAQRDSLVAGKPNAERKESGDFGGWEWLGDRKGFSRIVQEIMEGITEAAHWLVFVVLLLVALASAQLCSAIRTAIHSTHNFLFFVLASSSIVSVLYWISRLTVLYGQCYLQCVGVEQRVRSAKSNGVKFSHEHAEKPTEETRARPWPGENEFLEKLEHLQEYVRRQSHSCRRCLPAGLQRYRATPQSYEDRYYALRWSHLYAEAVRTRHMRPSLPFFKYVMSHPLSALPLLPKSWIFQVHSWHV